MRTWPTWAWVLLGAIVGYALLLIPAAAPTSPPSTEDIAFKWDRDAFWRQLEQRFEEARSRPCAELQRQLARDREHVERLVERLQYSAPSNDQLVELRERVFELGPQLAACPDNLSWFSPLQARLRASVKQLSTTEPSANQRATMYQLLYGSRAVLEEAQLQAPQDAIAPIQHGSAEASQTPSAAVQGITLHSGDLLLSRGGAPTSALIARGNDFPGNFSHVALVHIEGGDLSIIEAHIESGVEVSTPERYLADKKLRVMVLRPRGSLPAVQSDPMLPHRAATAALARARNERIRYDFAMNASDPSELFCSEVASSAYAPLGIELWSEHSRMSDPALRAWLASLGVRHFETQAPSDLEYDPAVTVVAEWRNPAALFDAHIDNAIIEAMLDNAGEARPLPYTTMTLPFFRLAKAFSYLLNAFGVVGPVPEGMDATAAARVHHFSAYHARQRQRLQTEATAFEKDYGYRPPYWRLVEIADRLVRAETL